jgi:hypothetical protein
MRRLTSLFSFWALMVFVALGLLQLLPFPGVILMLVGGALWCGLALHAFLIGLGVEAALGRVPRFILIVPLAAYSAYYVMYLQQAREIDAKARQLKASNPSLVLTFDLARTAAYARAARGRALRRAGDLRCPAEFQAGGICLAPSAGS